MARSARRRAGERLAATLPPKTPGRHRWHLNLVYPFTDQQATAAMSGAELAIDPDRCVALALVLCLDCNLPWSDVAGQACRADDQFALLTVPPTETSTT